MLKFVVLGLLALSVSGARIGRKFGGKIVGGVDVDIKDFPYQLSLQNRGYHSCGASIIAKNIALTAAHCTDGESAGSLSVRTTSTLVEQGGKVIRVDRFIQHPKYRFPDYDFSVLFLAGDLPIGQPGCEIIKLAEEGGPPAEHTKVNVTGWGTTEPGGSIPDVLQMIEVEVFSMETCRKIYGSQMTDRLFCAGVPEGGKDACQGDSGGPIVSNGVLLGAVSGGYSCAEPMFPTYYASVPNLREWIRSVSGV